MNFDINFSMIWFSLFLLGYIQVIYCKSGIIAVSRLVESDAAKSEDAEQLGGKYANTIMWYPV